MYMEESLAWLRTPETQPALGDLLCGLIRDIRLILVHSDLGTAAKLGAITETVDQLAPPPGPKASGAQAAASVVALLARNTGPATILFEELAGEEIRIELTGCAGRPLTPAECRDLRVSAGARGYERTGTLRTVSSGLVAAEVCSVVLPGRLPASARAALGIPGPDERLRRRPMSRWARRWPATACAGSRSARAWSATTAPAARAVACRSRHQRGCGSRTRPSRWQASG